MSSFKDLCALHTGEMGETAWREYYPAMAVYLTDADLETRQSAVRRLSRDLMFSEDRAEHQARNAGHGWEIPHAARLAWLICKLERAHTRFNDVLPAFLKDLSVSGDDWVLMAPLRAWLGAMLADTPSGVDPHTVEAALLRTQSAGDETPEDRARLIALLDHPSSLVRAEAASTLSDFDDDQIALFALIKEKEMLRPGVAGPFWSKFHMDDWSRSPIDAVAWMLDILEQRSGPEPSLDEMGYVGIDFYLHELCSTKPEAVRRMITGGHVELAIETACEMRCRMPGMEPILIELGHHADPRIAKPAQRQLAVFYRVLHPAISDRSIRHWPDWASEAEMLSVHWGENQALWFIVLYPRNSPVFDNTTAWRLIDRALPPGLRGATVRHQLDWKKDEPPGAYDTATSRMMQFAYGANLTFDGDVKAEHWNRIEIGGAKLGDRWTPFADAKLPASGAGET